MDATTRAPQEFTLHRRTAYGAVAAALVLVSVAEIVAVHLLLMGWSTTAAWIATGLGLYGMVAVVADYRAVRTRPHRVDDTTLSLRRGTLMRLDAPLEAVEAIRLPDSDERAAPREAVEVSMALPTAPWVVVEFGRPVTLRGPLGISKSVRRIGVSVDDPDGFVAAVRERLERDRGAAAPTTND